MLDALSEPLHENNCCVDDPNTDERDSSAIYCYDIMFCSVGQDQKQCETLMVAKKLNFAGMCAVDRSNFRLAMDAL